ncbi:MFS transporter [Brevibacterium casei]|uniref:MFS transporter n=1 Tax=Brevibacterium casei TaxID=33889 RepID=UPI003F7EB58E
MAGQDQQQPQPQPAPRVAPFGATATVVAVTAVVVLSQLYGAIPLFAPVQSAFGVDAGLVAWVQTAFGIAYAAGFIAWGPLVDRFGPRRIMLLGLTTLIITTVLTSFAPSFTWLIVGRVVQGVFAASFAPAAFAYLGARPAPERRVLSITVLTSSFLASAVIGQVAAQFITDRLGWEWFFWIGALALALTAVLIRTVFLADLPITQTAGNPAKVLGGLLARVPVLVLLVATVMVLGPMIALYTAVGTTGLADSNTLLILRASALPALVWAPFGNRWLSRFAPHRRLIAAFLIAGVAAAAVSLVPGNVIGVGVAMFAVAAAVAVSAPAMIQTLSGYAPEARGSVTALYTCFLFLGASITPALVTTTDASLTETALIGGLASLVAAGLVLLARARTPRN